MQILIRPCSNRMICGVAIGIAERYGISTALIRAIFVAGFFAAPLTLLLYLLLALSMTSEVNIAGTLRLRSSDAPLTPNEEFERISQSLASRLLTTRSAPILPPYILAIWLLVLAALLELPRIGGLTSYLMHPILAAIMNDLSLAGAPIFFLCIALLFLFPGKQPSTLPVFVTPNRDTFSLDNRSEKMIGGVISGLARVLEIDPAYVRVIFIVLNVLTLGVVGAGYLLVWVPLPWEGIIPTA